jgi:YidC/Oxa1 family membrane protein insertase
MRMNPTPPDPTQAAIFTWMPIIFTFMMASFPAGLVIYWAWNNTLSIIQQGVIMKRQGSRSSYGTILQACCARNQVPPNSGGGSILDHLRHESRMAFR